MKSTDPANPGETCTTLEVASLLGLAVRSVQLMVDRGELEAWKTPGGHRRIARASVDRWLAARQGSPRPEPAATRRTSAPRVLLIEDSTHYQNLVRLLLAQKFPQVELHIADEGIAGLAMAGQLRPQVLIVDILLPGIDGATLITSLRSHPQFSGSQLIVITSLDEAQREPYGFALAGVPVVHKPQLVAQLPPLLAERLAAATGRRRVMSRARVLLVDDDASIRRFVALALEDLPIDLIACASVPQAREALRAAPVRLLITDLMMPGESGLDLLQQLADDPTLRGDARLAVFSAGLNAAMQERLAGFDVWRQLAKPISVVALDACVRDALAEAPRAAATPTVTPPPPADPSATEDAAVAQHFAGERALFEAFRASCLTQFVADAHAGDAALQRGDLPVLHRLGHSLKSVLTTLGRAAPAAMARELEQAASLGDAERTRAAWFDLRRHLAAPD